MSEHTPGPWAWFGNADNKSIYLATTHSGRRYVMGFRRWGMRGAQPCFQPEGKGLVDASDLLKFAVGNPNVVGLGAARQDASVYRFDIADIDCADARLIAAAPDLLAALEMALRVMPRPLDDADRSLAATAHIVGAAAIAKARGQ